MNRRGFLTGVAGLLAAPAIVRASSLMPVSVLPVETRGILPLPYRTTGRAGAVLVSGFDQYGNRVVEWVDIGGASKTKFKEIEAIEIATAPDAFAAYDDTPKFFQRDLV